MIVEIQKVWNPLGIGALPNPRPRISRGYSKPMEETQTMRKEKLIHSLFMVR